MKIFKDRDLSQPVGEVINLGIVPAGTTKRFTFWVVNDSGAFLRALKFSVDHKEVEVIKSPETLKLQGSDSLVLEWNPSITLKKGLKTRIQVTGEELWG